MNRIKNMYRENRKSINAQVGCEHKCAYCIPSFQRQAKRQGKRCQKCHDFIPHFHPERLLKAPPKTTGDEFVFFPSMGDPTFAYPDDVDAMITYAEKYPNTKFLMQTKAPSFFFERKFPDNTILGITLETNQCSFLTPSQFKNYGQISLAPPPENRAFDFRLTSHPNKIITIEPILQFNLNDFVDMIRLINSQVVYIGYDNHGCKLPEPTLMETQRLIKELEIFTTVRVKSLRKAWYEEGGLGK